jgi:hypothetical protein
MRGFREALWLQQLRGLLGGFFHLFLVFLQNFYYLLRLISPQVLIDQGSFQGTLNILRFATLRQLLKRAYLGLLPLLVI